MGTYDDEFLPVHKPHVRGDTDAATRAHTGGPTEHRILQLQRDAGNGRVAQLLRDENEGAAVERLVAGGGRPLDPATQVNMESAFGESFEDVRVHTGGEATASAQRLGAHAYTVGNDVVFSDSHYDPSSTSGQRVLAHELTHVVQQRSGPVDGTDTGAGVKVSDPDDRFERAAEESADRVTSGQAASTSDTATAGAPAVQREAAPEEEPEEAVQGMWVQRQGAEEEEMPEEG